VLSAERYGAERCSTGYSLGPVGLRSLCRLIVIAHRICPLLKVELGPMIRDSRADKSGRISCAVGSNAVPVY